MRRPVRDTPRSRNRWSAGLIGGTAVMIATVAPAGPAYPAAGGTPVQVSGPSPFASCTADGTPGDGFTPNSESEAQVAVDPGRPGRIAVAYRQDLWASGSSRGIVIGGS